MNLNAFNDQAILFLSEGKGEVRTDQVLCRNHTDNFSIAINTILKYVKHL